MLTKTLLFRRSSLPVQAKTIKRKPFIITANMQQSRTTNMQKRKDVSLKKPFTNQNEYGAHKVEVLEIGKKKIIASNISMKKNFLVGFITNLKQNVLRTALSHN